MTACKDGRENLLDDFFLTNDDFMKLLLHHFAMLTEFLKHIAETTLFSGHTALLVMFGSIVCLY
jgi:hypothetical protein